MNAATATGRIVGAARRMTLAHRLTATLVVVALLALLAIAVAAASFAAVERQQNEVVDRYYSAVRTSHDAFVGVLAVEAAVRGYAVTGDRSLLEPFLTAERSPGSGGTRLRTLVEDDPASSQALEAAIGSYGTWYERWAVPTVQRVESQGPRAVDRARLDDGERLFGEVRRGYGVYLDTLDDRRQQAVDELSDRTEVLFASVLALAATVAVFLVALMLLLRRWVTGPITALADETRVVRDGDLEHRVAVSGPPEISRLGRDVEAMRRRLVEEVGAAQQSSDALTAARDVLAERSADLERSNRELEQFAYVASHDLQEPLRKVASFCQLLQRRYSGQLDERGEQYIEFAVDGAKRMQNLINALLDFSRVGRVTAARTDVDLGGCLERALRDLESAIEESGAVVTHGELPVVCGEAALLKQVLANLVGNAIKFRRDEPPRVHLDARLDGDLWEISCTDNGIGIEPQYAERVFAIFQRLHAKEVYGGTGIGLAICKKIVEYHGGTIWVDTTTAGAGTTIRWTIPVVRSGHEAADGAPSGAGAATDHNAPAASPVGVPAASTDRTGEQHHV